MKNREGGRETTAFKLRSGRVILVTLGIRHVRCKRTVKWSCLTPTSEWSLLSILSFKCSLMSSKNSSWSVTPMGKWTHRNRVEAAADSEHGAKVSVGVFEVAKLLPQPNADVKRRRKTRTHLARREVSQVADMRTRRNCGLRDRDNEANKAFWQRKWGKQSFLTGITSNTTLTCIGGRTQGSEALSEPHQHQCLFRAPHQWQQHRSGKGPCHA